jgi:hypothetical protein
MTSYIKQLGFDEGVIAAQNAFNSGLGCKSVLALEAPCQRKRFMQEYGFGREKALRMAMKYESSFCRGVAEVAFYG